MMVSMRPAKTVRGYSTIGVFMVCCYNAEILFTGSPYESQPTI